MTTVCGGTALNFFERLRDRGTLNGLEPNLFKSGPQTRELIELLGEHSTGKTLLITCLIKTVILPKDYKTKFIGGLETEVVLLNSDLHFNIEKLSNMLYSHLAEHLLLHEDSCQSPVVTEIVNSALKRLTILNIYNSDTMWMTFHLLKKLLTVNPRISLIVFDSISAYYWQERCINGALRMDLYIQNIINSLHQCISSFNVALIFTLPAYFQSKFNSECSSVYDLRNVNTCIHLRVRMGNYGPVYHAEIKTATTLSVRFYDINDSGFVWCN